jgi:hypothetical protein
MKRKPNKNKERFMIPTLDMTIVENGVKICKHSAPINTIIPLTKDIYSLNFEDVAKKNILFVDKNTYEFFKNKK